MVETVDIISIIVVCIAQFSALYAVHGVIAAQQERIRELERSRDELIERGWAETAPGREGEAR